ncbi:MAG: cobyric acid synthase [Methanomicrobia archaeon]|nr:cobyric acid synthase [Methanomicrobia archaeon]
MAKRIMVQGTGSHVGKSVIVAALCRIFLQDGYRVAPFKSQNMALNSYVTKDGLEIGRAQAFQAFAAGKEPTVEMNPILLKPTSDVGAQVIVRGRPVGNMTAQEYHEYKSAALTLIKECFEKLDRENEIVAIEGAGSPAEVNLRENDIVNMSIAKLLDAPVLLLGDIDKGGVFASIVGTLELLEEDERELLKGFLINKFRGDLEILKPGLEFLEKRTRKPVLGVIPYFQDIRIQEEDSVSLSGKTGQIKGMRHGEKREILIKVVQLPRISNFTDFDALEAENDVLLRYVGEGDKLGEPDVIIIPGSKNTISDLSYLKESGYASEIVEKARTGKCVVFGICGGYQMLCESLIDPEGVESTLGELEGLGLLPARTTFESHDLKMTNQVRAIADLAFYQGEIAGYEIHMGRTYFSEEGVKPAFTIVERSGKAVPNESGGAAFGNVIGTYIHGIFDNDDFRQAFLDYIRAKKGLPTAVPVRSAAKNRGESTAGINWDNEYNKLADLVRGSIDMDKLYEIVLRDGLQ